MLAVRDSRLCCRFDAEVGVVCTSDAAPAGTPETLLGLGAEDREDATDAEDDGLLWNAAEEDEGMVVTVVTVPAFIRRGRLVEEGVRMKAASCDTQGRPCLK